MLNGIYKYFVFTANNNDHNNKEGDVSKDRGGQRLMKMVDSIDNMQR